MNTLLRRVSLGLTFYLTAKMFDFLVKPNLPDGYYGVLLYFGAAASVDWFMFYSCQKIVFGTLRRDMEALCIASILANALGFALYMAPSPPIPYPDAYVWTIYGINHVLAIRLLFLGDGNVFHHLDNFNWRAVVRGSADRYLRHYAKEKEA